MQIDIFLQCPRQRFGSPVLNIVSQGKQSRSTIPTNHSSNGFLLKDMVKATNIALLSLLTSLGYNKKESNLKNCSQQNKVIFTLNLHKVQNEKKILDL